MAARCRKFVPNLFNKNKCQSCFGSKEAHSAEALESSKAARKVSKCAYLFVAPELDFSNPLHRAKRWQRRFFILYDDGELTYSVDDNPSTVPQGSVDMNSCTDVFEADSAIGHEFAIGIQVPGHDTLYVKGISKEEIGRWFDVLVMYPRSLSIKTKRGPSKQGGITRHHSYYPSGSEKSVSDDDDADSIKSKDSDVYERVSRTKGRLKQRDIRRCKSEVRPSDLRLAEDEYNARNKSSRESSPASSAAAPTLSLVKFDATMEKGSHTRERSIDSTDSATSSTASSCHRKGEPETFTSVRSMKQKKANKNANYPSAADVRTHATPPGGEQASLMTLTKQVIVPEEILNSELKPKVDSIFADSSDILHSKRNSEPPAESAVTIRGGSSRRPVSMVSSMPTAVDSALAAHGSRVRPLMTTVSNPPVAVASRPGLSRRPASMVSAMPSAIESAVSTHLTSRRPVSLGAIGTEPNVLTPVNAQSAVVAPADGPPLTAATDRNTSNIAGPVKGDSPVHLESNETDEHKIAKSEQRKTLSEKAPTVRKGWLVLQDRRSKAWSKHWFVLCGDILTYFKDAKAEETNEVDGVIDIGDSREVSTIKADRNHGFKIKTKNGEHVLSAMTSGIRRNWMEAVEGIIAERRRAEEKSAKQDMGFVFEPPVRSSQAPAVASSAPTVPELAPVMPDPSSRVNSTLRDIAEKRKHTGDDTPLDELYAPDTDSRLRTNSFKSELPAEQPVSSASHPMSISTTSAVGVHSVDEVDLHLPSSPSHISPSQRIKEKSRAKTPPRSRSPPPPSPMGAARLLAAASVALVPSGGGSSDENDESLMAKLVEAQKQIQHLQQNVQDANSNLRKQRVEIESLQTKLDLTTSQLHDMETSLTSSAQNLTKERKHVQKLQEALSRQQSGSEAVNVWMEKCAKLEKQLQDSQSSASSNDAETMRQLKVQLAERSTKLDTLEKVLTNTRRHLQDAGERVRDTELHYQIKLEEMKTEFDEERTELQEKLVELEERLQQYLTTQSNNCVNSDLNDDVTKHLVKERIGSVHRLEELVKEQKGKVTQLNEENVLILEQLDEAQAAKRQLNELKSQMDSLEITNEELRKSGQVLLKNVDSLRKQMRDKDADLAMKNQENINLLATINQLENRCKHLQSVSSAAKQSDVPDKERQELRRELETITAELNAALRASQAEIANLGSLAVEREREIERSRAEIHSLKEKCTHLENALRSAEQHSSALASTGQSAGIEKSLLVVFLESVIRSCERMIESAVAMLAGEMIETDIKVSLAFNSEQRALLGSKAIEQLQKKCSGIKQRLNYILKMSTSKQQIDKLEAERTELKQKIAQLETLNGSRVATPTPAVGPSSATIPSQQLVSILVQCKTELLSLTSVLGRTDAANVVAAVQRLTALLNAIERPCFDQIIENRAVAGYCEHLALKAAVLFDIARWDNQRENTGTIDQWLKRSLARGSGLANIEDVAVRNFASLVMERLFINHELEQLISEGSWQSQASPLSEVSSTTTAMAAEALLRLSIDNKNRDNLLDTTTTQNHVTIYLHQLKHSNLNALPAHESCLLQEELRTVKAMTDQVEIRISAALQAYCMEYTKDLITYGIISLAQMDQFVSLVTESLFSSVLELCQKCSISELTTGWLHQQVCSRRQEFDGISMKTMPHDLPDLVVLRSMLMIKFGYISRLQQSWVSDLSRQALEQEARKMQALADQLHHQVPAAGSCEARISYLVERLNDTDCLIDAHTRPYGDAVQQVMREVVYGAQSCLLRLSLISAPMARSATDVELREQLQRVKLELVTAHDSVSGTEKSSARGSVPSVQSLRDEMEAMKLEHSRELEESKKDMKMVLKSVKAEEKRLAVELTEEIAVLKEQLLEERRRHQAELEETKLLARSHPATDEVQAMLKDKIRDLENCLHEMQEEFEEELYQERQSHLIELDQARAELINVISKADSNQLTAEEIRDHYEREIDKIKAEQATLQQWIDDIREAHKDEIDALLHEKDTALADEVASTQAALGAMKASHEIQLNEERSKITNLQQRTSQLTEIERTCLLLSRESETKDKRLSSLEEKISSLNKSLAKCEVDIRRSSETSQQLRDANSLLTARNRQLVEQFAKELRTIRIDASATSIQHAQHVALQAQVESLSLALAAEQRERQLLAEQLLQCTSSHLSRQQEAEPAEETEADSVQRPTGSSANIQGAHLGARRPSLTSFPHLRLIRTDNATLAAPSGSYDLSRSKSNPVIPDKPSYGRKRNSDASLADVRLTNAITAFQDRYHKSGGLTIAERMRKFNA